MAASATSPPCARSCRRRVPAPADGREPGDLRHDHPAATAPGSRSGAGSRHPATAPPDHSVRDPPSPIPAPTPQHHRPPRRDGDSGCSTAGRSTSPASTKTDNVLVVARAGTRDRQSQTGPLRGPDRLRRLRGAGDPDGDREPWLQFQCSSTSGCQPTRSSATGTAGWCELFAGLNPEAHHGRVVLHQAGQFALDRTSAYMRRTVFKDAIPAPPTSTHPLAQSHIEIELARLMTKAAALYDARDDIRAGRPRTWPSTRPAGRPAAGRRRGADPRWQQDHPGYGMAGLLIATRASRIAPVSRDDPQLRRHALVGAAEVVLTRDWRRRRSVSVVELVAGGRVCRDPRSQLCASCGSSLAFGRGRSSGSW